MAWTRRRIAPAPPHGLLRLIAAVFILALGGCASTGGPKPVQQDTAQAPATVDPPHVARLAPPVAEPAPEPPKDLWDRIRAGFALPPVDSPHVRYYEQWYSERPEYMANMVARASRYLYYIVEQVEARGMPTEIALLPAIESAFKPHAYSRAHAAGLWQFIPSTGRRYGLKQDWWYDGRRDVVAATDAALDYLEELHKEFDGDWHLALAAYNAGENGVRRKIDYNERNGHSTEYTALRLRRETAHYVPKLIAVVNIIREPEKFGLTLASIPNEPYFARVDVGGQIDLGVVARLTAMNPDELYDLNPAFRRWATDPGGPHQLLVPIGKREPLAQGLKSLPTSARMQWSRYQVRQGDNLSRIASRYGLSVSAIKSTNRLRGTLIKAGQNLLIPISSRSATRTARAKPTKVATASPRMVGNISASNAGGKVVHSVRKGDTLWGIARRYNVYVHQLASWNGISSHDVLKLGQKLLVWTN
jgi:membrane-bound lytic murein transglycosylase D